MIEIPVDGCCARCGQNIPAWLTFTLGRGGRVYCSEYCQRLDEQSRNAPRPDLSDGDPASNGGNGASGDVSDGGSDDGADSSDRRKRLRFLSRLR